MSKAKEQDKKPTYAQQFADDVVAAIEAGRAPWQKDWKPGVVIAPFNPESGTQYKGGNILRHTGGMQ